MYERRFGLPRAGIAALWLEGQLPKPALLAPAALDASRPMSFAVARQSYPPKRENDRR